MSAFFAVTFVTAAEEPRKKDVVVDPSPAWIVAVTAFNTEKLVASDRLSGDLIVNRLSFALSNVGKRRYTDAERGAYMRYLVTKATDAAVKELAAKQAARDALLFSGLENWKYEAELKKADEAVRAAREAYELSRHALAEVAPVKDLKIAKENAARALVPLPKIGEERSLCEQHKYDALLLGQVESFYGRTFVSIRLYSPFLNTNLYSDETTFSTTDRETVLAELSFRLAAAASGTPPALVSVRVDPPEADVHLNGVFSGSGSVGPVERAPGPLRVTAERFGYERLETMIDVFPAERTDVAITLPAFKTSSVAVDAFGVSGEKTESKVRLNGLYIGRTPMTLTIPQGMYSFVQLESSDEKSADQKFADKRTEDQGAGDQGAVDLTHISSDRLTSDELSSDGPVSDGKLSDDTTANRPSEKSSAFSTVVNTQTDGSISLKLVELLPKNATPTEDARKVFYGALGRFFLCMPIAFIVSGMASSYENAAIVYNSTALTDVTSQMKLASTILWTVSGAFAVETIIRLVNYLRNSGSRAAKSTPINGS